MLTGTQVFGLMNFQPQDVKAYFGGRLIATGVFAQPQNTVTFTAVVTDRLGSVRVRGSQTMRYFPYGDEQTPTANGFDKFATYLRDANGLDYADQGFHHPGVGRFMSADPSMHGTDLGDPQSWNRFAYAQGDPANSIDPSGLFP